MAVLSEFPKYMNLLVYGITVEKMQELHNHYPSCLVHYNNHQSIPCLSLGTLDVYNFVGDCGTLCITGANIASDISLDFLAEFASLSGFSKILATVCSKTPEFIVNRFLNRGWEVVKKSKSNRNPEKEHYIMLLSIDCVHKGY